MHSEERLRVFIFKWAQLWGESEDRVQAEGSPEEAEVGWLEQRGGGQRSARL